MRLLSSFFCISICLISGSLFGQTILIDYSDGALQPNLGGVWNEIPDLTSTNISLFASDGSSSGASLDLNIVGGTTFGFTQTSWALGDVGFVDSSAIDDIFGFNNDASVTFSGLDPNQAYRVDHIAARDNFFGIADYTVDGSFGDSPVNGQGYSAFDDGFSLGSIITWNSVFPNSNGQLVLAVAPAGGFGYLSATRITAVPEPSVLGVAMICGGIAGLKRRRKYV